jgi:hypothetical protein
MKKIAILICLLFCMNTFVFADDSDCGPSQNPNARFRLFPTKNMWTFLKLDTMTGEIWQVQYSTDGPNYRFETVLNSTDIAWLRSLERVVGRYTLYPTQNTYNFILLDQINGSTFQVQWARDPGERMILQISK